MSRRFLVSGAALRILLAAFMGCWAGSQTIEARAGKKVYVGRQVAQHQRVGFDRIDHRGWDALLRKYVDRDGFVDYTAWHRSAEDMRALDAYLAHLSHADPRHGGSAAAQIAYWTNAYNAVTIKGILREYPTTSIRNHTAKVVGYNIWKDLLLHVGDSAYSLDQMEHQILRKMGEPRIHFAIVCASRGCPRLLNQAYTATQLNEQLERNTRDFFGRSQNFQFDARGQRFHLSSILQWFGEDFGRNQREQLAWMAPYLPTEAARQAARRGPARVSYLKYNWNLNDQKTLRRR